MSCGRGDQGALGHKDCNLEDCLKPRLVEELLSTDTLTVSCGESHVVALTSDGEVYAWGNGRNGRLGTGNEDMWLVRSGMRSIINFLKGYKNITCVSVKIYVREYEHYQNFIWRTLVLLCCTSNQTSLES